MSKPNIVYSVTVLDVKFDSVLGIRSTPIICTSLELAYSIVRNNEQNLNDNNLYQYAVIEETELNVVRPTLFRNSSKWWFKFNCVLQEFEPCSGMDIPPNIRKLTGFCIG